MKIISSYHVEDQPLGTGGMGRVLCGIDAQGRQVAIKEILPEFASDFEIRTRTEREVEILQILNNTDGIVKVYDRFPLNGNFYIVMELIDGNNVEQYVQKYGAIPYERAVSYMIKILGIMQSVHEKDIVHRDMKPSNIMIRNDERVCILDFGIAKDMGNTNGRTLIGTIIGSDGYMSPEQADGFSIDHRADIYALGCVFYFMLTGHHAYDTLSSDFETRENIANTPFPRLSKYSRKSFPEKLQEILDHATDKNMLRRYQSCREFRKDLESIVPKTVISMSRKDDIFITVGREGCDILVTDNQMRVSRSHMDIAFRQFTGGRYYVISDHSSNGTMVNGRRLGRGESENIPAEGPAPEVYLACDRNYPLDWDEVKRRIAAKLSASAEWKGDPVGGTQYDFVGDNADSPVNGVSTNVSFMEAIRLLFTRAFDIKGRSRRKEYWYVVLLNFLMQVVCGIAILVALLNRSEGIMMGFAAVYCIYALACIIPFITLTLRRLHDTGKSWKYFLLWILAVVPFVNFIASPVVSVLWIVWMATDSDPEENEWGSCPK